MCCLILRLRCQQLVNKSFMWQFCVWQEFSFVSGTFFLEWINESIKHSIMHFIPNVYVSHCYDGLNKNYDAVDWHWRSVKKVGKHATTVISIYRPLTGWDISYIYIIIGDLRTQHVLRTEEKYNRSQIIISEPNRTQNVCLKPTSWVSVHKRQQRK